MCYRNDPTKFVSVDVSPEFRGELIKAEALSPQLHFGELMQEIEPRIWEATSHFVMPDEYKSQYSAVFFAIPDWDAVLPSGIKVGDWLAERYARSRKEKY